MTLQIILLLSGLVLLIKGADWLVEGASVLARKNGISDLAIGLTIVAFGTSAPELVVNTFAAFKGNHAIVYGNVIGSNNLNLFVILGIAGLITPLTVQSSTVRIEIPLSLLAIIVLFVMSNDFLISGENSLGRIDGIMLLLFFVAFLFYVYKQLKSDFSIEETNQKKIYSSFKTWLYILTGLAGLIVGGRLVLDNAVKMATTMGVSEKIIGLTIIAAGTSFPELATSVIAAIKKNNDIAVGNIIGSNIFNIFFILATSSLVKPVLYDVKFNSDIYLLAGGTLLLFITMFTGKRQKLDRWEAAILLIAYVGYSVYLFK
ncbi:MAG: calcium/sodium antiporter [Bacteroidetes bacterium]|jgi:cation:H+ antiporter|nr:calcium/sodium antiporter [Bacteroidota bacterium]